MKRHKIVVIEDEPDILENLRFNLDREGFEVACAANGVEGLDVVRRECPDLVLLDLLLPDLGGMEVCRTLKSESATKKIPIIMVTAKGEEADIVLGLGLGADDYATKPFSPRELIARVRAVLRRSETTQRSESGERLIRDGLVIDTLKHEVTVDGDPVSLTPTEFRLLLCLAAQPGRVFGRDYLVSQVIGEGVSVVDRTIDVHVQAIRKKLGDQRELVETVRGVGYKFRENG